MNTLKSAVRNLEEKRVKGLFWTLIVGAIVLNLWSVRDFLFLSKEKAIQVVILKIIIGIIWFAIAFITKKYKKFYRIGVHIAFVSLTVLMLYIINIASIKDLNSIFFNFGTGFLLLTIFAKVSWIDVLIAIVLRGALILPYVVLSDKYTFTDFLNNGLIIIMSIGVFTLFFAYYLEKLELEAEMHKLEIEIANEELKETNEEIKQYAAKLEEKNTDIRKSLVYASYIQRSLLTDKEMLNKILGQNYFLIYKPRDIVSGDFYWAREKNGYKYVAVADATGHGVPAALVSIYCNEALNSAFESLEDPTPAEILEMARELVIKAFTREDRKLNEGMDISLIKYNNSELTFSGASSSALLYCPEKEDSIIRLKGTPTPIGNFPFEKKPFVNVSITLNKIKMIYLLSDGIVHQIGGEFGKKLGYKRFSAILVKIAEKPLPQQKQILEQFIIKWIGDHQQIDDITVLGIKIK